MIFNETLTFTASATDPQCFEGIPVAEDTIFEGLPEALEGILFVASISSGGSPAMKQLFGTAVITDTTGWLLVHVMYIGRDLKSSSTMSLLVHGDK